MHAHTYLPLMRNVADDRDDARLTEALWGRDEFADCGRLSDLPGPHAP